ncbi:hypothetical protein EWM64_g6248 [Hericium alpestre]|uniref:Uncharacterized protein n=1 Tax=Hericium alpestre TaxID=135208 RepID=A0A4Y9ZT70_9AGAM|nr:hypothetical protein EWM64_g6248 [Hericium alpestre]
MQFNRSFLAAFLLVFVLLSSPVLARHGDDDDGDGDRGGDNDGDRDRDGDRVDTFNHFPC